MAILFWSEMIEINMQNDSHKLSTWKSKWHPNMPVKLVQGLASFCRLSLQYAEGLTNWCARTFFSRCRHFATQPKHWTRNIIYEHNPHLSQAHVSSKLLRDIYQYTDSATRQTLGVAHDTVRPASVASWEAKGASHTSNIQLLHSASFSRDTQGTLPTSSSYHQPIYKCL